MRRPRPPVKPTPNGRPVVKAVAAVLPAADLGSVGDRVMGLTYAPELTPPPPPSPSPEPLTVEVTLNGRDGAAVRALAEDEYRTPAQQVGWIVAQWFRGRAGVAATLTKPLGPATNGHTPAPAPSLPPNLLPVYHRGELNSAGSGCGKVGLLFARRIALGDTINPGDVFTPDGEIVTGPLVCGSCGIPLGPHNWEIP